MSRPRRPADFIDYDYEGAGKGPQQRKAPLVVTREPTIGPWQGNVQWANSFNDLLPIDENQEVPVANLDSAPGPPRVYTITLGRSDYSLDNAANADVRAKIVYGSGGIKNSFLCDWGAGTQISLVASEIRVTGISWRPIQAFAYSRGTTAVRLYASFGEGDQGHSPVYLSERKQTINNGATVRFDRPDFATHVSVQLADMTIDPNLVWGPEMQGGAFNFIPSDNAWGQAFQPIIMPNGSDKFTIINGTAALKSVSVIWHLAL
jgi:hypothetical protein